MAVIRKVSQTGLVTVMFNADIMVPDNFRDFNSTIMQVDILKNRYQQKDLDLTFSWEVVDF